MNPFVVWEWLASSPTALLVISPTYFLYILSSIYKMWFKGDSQSGYPCEKL